MGWRLFRSDGFHRHLQASPNDFGNLPQGYTFLRHGVVFRTGFVLLQSKPVEVAHIRDMRGRPAVRTITDVRETPFSRATAMA